MALRGGRGLAWLAALTLLGCPSGSAPGASCSRSSECGASLVCRFGRCRNECVSSRDCPQGAACIRDGSAGVCRLDLETRCSGDADCGGALVCVAGTCRNHCRDASDCAPGAACVADATAGTVCVEPLDGVDAGALDASGPGDLVLVVSADADDGEIEAANGLHVMGEGFQLYAGSSTAAPTRVFFRFALPQAIPAGATVEAAHLELWGTELYDSGGVCAPTFRIGIVADDTADAIVVSSRDQWPGGPTGAPSTSASVSWAFVTSWQVGVRNASPDLAPILNELVLHHGGFAAGAHVQLWSWAENFMAECAAGSEDFASIASHPAELHLRIR